MIKLGLVLAMASAMLAGGATTARQDAAQEKAKGTTAEALTGTWTMVSVEKGGEKKTGDDVGGQVCVFTKDAIEQTIGDMEFAYKYTLDSSKSPAQIDLEITESPFGAGATAEGIIEVKGDEMRLAYSTEGERPASFDPEKAGADVRICVLKRKE